MAFAIDDLTSVIAHWNAADISGVADGDPVGTLPESISSWDMTASGTERPLYRATSSINSQPAIELDGTDDWMITASKTLSGIDNASWAAVIYLDVLKNWNTLYHVNKASGTPAYNAANTVIEGQAYSDGSVLLGMRDTSRGFYRSSPGSVSATTSYLITGIHGKGNVAIKLDGSHSTNTVGGQPTHANPNATVYASFGESSLANFDGLLAELVFWDETELSEHAWIEGVLADTYGITLPTWHPFSGGAPTSAPGGGGGGGTSFDPFRSIVY
jgi:hypothetical protein